MDGLEAKNFVTLSPGHVMLKALAMDGQRSVDNGDRVLNITSNELQTITKLPSNKKK